QCSALAFPAALPAAAYPLLAVPSGGIDSCVATAELTLITAPDGRELICVGERRCIVMCLNPANGQVVDMVVDPRGEGHASRGSRAGQQSQSRRPRSPGPVSCIRPLSWRFSRPL